VEAVTRSFYTSDGTRIAYRVTGPADGPVMILCDGIACAGFAWKYLLPHWSKTYRVVHAHHRGHGRSGVPRDEGQVTIPYLARDVKELMAHLDITSGIFVGHSMGCQVILEMAIRYPSCVSAAVLLCAAHGRTLDTFGGTDLGYRILPRIQRFMARFGRQLEPALRFLVPSRLGYELAVLSEIDRSRTPPDEFKGYLEHLSRMAHDVFMKMLQDAAERCSSHFWSAIKVPILLMPAERDGFTPLDTNDALRDGLSSPRCHVIADASHIAPVEFPEVIIEHMDRFLTDIPNQVPDESVRFDIATRWRAASRQRLENSVVTSEAS
jgi:pimeloyl-ACP methyl ester carboxylesterase